MEILFVHTIKIFLSFTEFNAINIFDSSIVNNFSETLVDLEMCLEIFYQILRILKNLGVQNSKFRDP